MSEMNLDPFGPNPEMYQLAMSEEARPLLEQVKSFIAPEVAPIADQFFLLHFISLAPPPIRSWGFLFWGSGP